MIDTCSKRCNPLSQDVDVEIVKNNCLDRCVFKYEKIRLIVEKELEKEINKQK